MHPSPISSAPCRRISAKSSFPDRSMNVTAFNITFTGWFGMAALCQQLRNSSTHGPASFPSKSKTTPVSSVCVVILNIFYAADASSHFLARAAHQIVVSSMLPAYAAQPPARSDRHRQRGHTNRSLSLSDLARSASPPELPQEKTMSGL
jgi:hypothetical protein